MKTCTELHGQLDSLRPQLLRFAHHRLHDHYWSEDLVQESLLAVLEAPDRFRGTSSLLTYVTSILKFKIIDHFRKQIRLHEIPSQDATEQDLDNIMMRGRYGVDQSSLCQEFNPLHALEQKKFFTQLEHALSDFSEKNAMAFTMADCFEITNDEICKQLNISKNNLMVTIHRVRQGLRKSSVMQSYSALTCH